MATPVRAWTTCRALVCPSELDVVDCVVMAVEMALSLMRAGLHAVKRKAELYDRVTGRRVDRVVVTTP